MSTAAPGAEALSAHALLRLMQLASPALPVGGFSYSEGLESAVDAGLVGSEAQAGDWLLDQLRLVLERSDLPLVAAAFAAWQVDDADRLQALNRWVLATREGAEPQQQVRQMGRSMLEWLKLREPPDPRVARLAALSPAPAWPLAFALAAVLSGAARRESMLAFGLGWAENMVQAAMRAVPLGQSAGQRILARLIDALPDAVDRAAALPHDAWQAFTPRLAILGSRHETQYSRLFRS